jgi:hypothetical protein
VADLYRKVRQRIDGGPRFYADERRVVAATLHVFMCNR